MQLTHHLKPAGVNATLVKNAPPPEIGFGRVTLADGVQILHGYGFQNETPGIPVAGDFFLVHPDGKTEFMPKAEFERRYQACELALSPSLGAMPPREVMEAAELVGRYFAQQNITQWELGPCKARFPGDNEQSKHRAPLDGILADLRAKRDKAPGEIRSAYNDVCDRLEMLNCLEAQIAAVDDISDYEIFSSLLPPYGFFLVRMRIDNNEGAAG